MADFELASRLGITFPTRNGVLGLNDLWSLPLQSSRAANLDDIAKELDARLKASTTSFVEERKPASQRDVVALDVVKRVIEWRQAENRRKAEEVEKANLKQQLLNALAEKEQEGIRSLSKEELIARINAL